MGTTPKRNEYYQFVNWYAMPAPMRELQTQKEFAKSIGVANETLSYWKHDPNWDEDVRRAINNWAREQTPNVIAGLYKKAVMTGNAAEVKLWLQYFEQFVEKTENMMPPTVIEINNEKKTLIINAFKNFGIIDNEPKTSQRNNKRLQPKKAGSKNIPRV